MASASNESGTMAGVDTEQTSTMPELSDAQAQFIPRHSPRTREIAHPSAELNRVLSSELDCTQSKIDALSTVLQNLPPGGFLRIPEYLVKSLLGTGSLDAMMSKLCVIGHAISKPMNIVHPSKEFTVEKLKRLLGSHLIIY